MRLGGRVRQQAVEVAAALTRNAVAATSAATRIAVARWWVLFVLGLLIAVTMAWRSQVGGDQLNLLARGWLLAAQHVWIPYGNRTSAGGFGPGGLTSILVALPLTVWSEYRAPVFLIVALSTLGYLLIDAMLPRSRGGQVRILFAIAYWLSPWRLFFSGHLHNPNFLLFFGALHLTTAHRLRSEPRFLTSLLHAAGLVFAVQLHPSAVMLSVASILLWLGGQMRVRLTGAVCGLAIGATTLVPYVVYALNDPSILPGSNAYIDNAPLRILSVLRGVLYWFRYSSFGFSRTFTQFDFSPLIGVFAAPLEAGLWLLRQLVAPPSVIVAAIANLWLFSRLRRRRPLRSRLTIRWLRLYVAAILVAAVISFTLSPTTIMSWQCVPAFHAAVLPLVLYAAVLLRTPRRAAVDVGVRVWLVLSIVFALAITFGAPVFRSAGRASYFVPLREHVILHDLGLTAHSTVTLGVDGGLPADVLTY
jgi:hypothetical protein